MFLSRYIIAVLLLLRSSQAQEFDNDSLRVAVNAWLDDPEAATITYGATIEDFQTWQVTDMSRLFQAATNFTADLNNWDTSSVTDMNHIFAGATAFDSPLDEWDVSQVTDFSQAFYQASSFTGESLGTWQTTSAINMEQMFLGATSFVGPENIEDWDVSLVTSMYGMFFEAASFDRSVNGWDMANAQFVNSIFERASSFSQKVCWPEMHSHAKCFQCFCGTSGAGFDLSDNCDLTVHPSIVAYSQACDPDDLLEDLVDNQVFSRPQDFRGGLDDATGTFTQGIAGLPSLGNPTEEGSYTFTTGGASGEREEASGESEQTGDYVVIAGAQREVSAASSWRARGLVPLLALLASISTRFC